MGMPTIEELEQQIAELERKIADEPRRLQEEHERELMEEESRRATLPPSQEVLDRKRESKLNVDLYTKKEVENIRNEQKRDIVLILLFIAAIAAMVGWIYTSVQPTL